MGQFADGVISRLRRQLALECPTYTWETEYPIAETPVDVVGIGDQYILIELEWRRADPADNAAKIFRHLSTSEIEAEEIIIIQLFTNYYDLVSGGVSSKQKNAEFVGEAAADSLDKVIYHPLEFDIDPPKSGKERPTEWEKKADSMVETVISIVEERNY